MVYPIHHQAILRQIKFIKRDNFYLTSRGFDNWSESYLCEIMNN